ncbi:MAG: ribonuclease P protein component [Candidatus Dormiibacterota bacterium]
MKPKYRLRLSADFRAVRAERRGAGDEVLRVQVKANSVGHPRVGIAVSKHLAGAVMRNRTRRRVRAAATGMLAELGAYDVVVFPRSGALAVDSGAITASLTRALLQAGTQR